MTPYHDRHGPAARFFIVFGGKWSQAPDKSKVLMNSSGAGDR
jgi:hypothetical protein